ncbi:MAG TPA: Stf0 family sulfotransferase [Caulobacteraceae bacterium]|jgi:LPS sulfotransferase NodH
MSLHQKVRAVARGARGWLFVPSVGNRPPVKSDASPPIGRWHPHFGEISGLRLEEWLGRFPESPAIRRSLLLATEERTGSEWLCQMLGALGRLGRPSEYLNTGWMRKFIEDYPEDVARQVEIARRAGTTENGIFATKLHTQHLDRLLQADRLTTAFPKPAFVRLSRRDRLGQAISAVRAYQTHAFHAHWDKSAAECYDAQAIHHMLKNLIQLSTRWTLYFSRNGIEPLQLYYEDLQQDPRGSLLKIAQHVGVELESGHPHLQAPPLAVQRDAVSLDWRARFVSELGDLDIFE